MTDGLVKRIRTVFEDTPEVASWLEQDGDSYDYDLAEARTHMLGMWETMQVAADRIEAQAAEIERLREALTTIRDRKWNTMTQGCDAACEAQSIARAALGERE